MTVSSYDAAYHVSSGSDRSELNIKNLHHLMGGKAECLEVRRRGACRQEGCRPEVLLDGQTLAPSSGRKAIKNFANLE